MGAEVNVFRENLDPDILSDNESSFIDGDEDDNSIRSVFGVDEASSHQSILDSRMNNDQDDNNDKSKHEEANKINESDEELSVSSSSSGNESSSFSNNIEPSAVDDSLIERLDAAEQELQSDIQESKMFLNAVDDSSEGGVSESEDIDDECDVENDEIEEDKRLLLDLKG